MFDDGTKTKGELLSEIKQLRTEYPERRETLLNLIRERKQLKKKYSGLRLNTKGLIQGTRIDLFECSDEIFEFRFRKLERMSRDDVGGVYNNIMSAFNTMQSWMNEHKFIKEHAEPVSRNTRERCSGMVMKVGQGHRKKVFNPGNSD